MDRVSVQATMVRCLCTCSWQSHSIFRDGVYWVCFYSGHSLVQDMKCRIFIVSMMKYMNIQTGAWLFTHPTEQLYSAFAYFLPIQKYSCSL